MLIHLKYLTFKLFKTISFYFLNITLKYSRFVFFLNLYIPFHLDVRIIDSE